MLRAFTKQFNVIEHQNKDRPEYRYSPGEAYQAALRLIQEWTDKSDVASVPRQRVL